MENEEGTKECPYCAETIKWKARKCRFCGEFLDGERPRHQQTTNVKDPGLAAVLSFVMPGLGQIYCGQIGTGLLAMIMCGGVYWGGVLAAPENIVLLVVGLGLHVLIISDAHKSAQMLGANSGSIALRSRNWVDTNLPGSSVDDATKAPEAPEAYVVPKGAKNSDAEEMHPDEERMKKVDREMWTIGLVLLFFFFLIFLKVFIVFFSKTSDRPKVSLSPSIGDRPIVVAVHRNRGDGLLRVGRLPV